MNALTLPYDSLPIDDRKPCSQPRQVISSERLEEACARLRCIRRMISQAVKAWRRGGQNVEAEIDALIAAEEEAVNAVKEAAQ